MRPVDAGVFVGLRMSSFIACPLCFRVVRLNDEYTLHGRLKYIKSLQLEDFQSGPCYFSKRRPVQCLCVFLCEIRSSVWNQPGSGEVLCFGNFKMCLCPSKCVRVCVFLYPHI